VRPEGLGKLEKIHLIGTRSRDLLVMKPKVIAVHFNGLNDLKTGLRIFRMIQEAGVLQPLEMQT
jgi:hypothetical protein